MSLDELLSEINSKRPAPPQEAIVYEATPYERFLDALLKGRHPAYCDLIWNGEAFHIVLMIHFQKPAQPTQAPPGPEGQAYRQEAYRRFKKIGPAEQAMVSIRVTVRNWLPVFAEVTIRPEAAGLLRIGTSQLMDWQNP